MTKRPRQATQAGADTTFAHIKMRLDNKGRGDFRAEGNTIWLYDAIAGSEEEAMYFGGVAPSQFIGQLAAMAGDVTLRINSPGGSVFGAQAMVAAIRQHSGKVTAQIDSLAASAASVIAVACADCIMVPGAMMMVHRAWGMTVGNEADMRQTADLLAKLDGTLAEAYAAKTGGTAQEALDLMAAETWFTAAEAVAAGLANSIMESDTQKPKAQWNLAAFAAAPKALAPNVTGYNDADVAFVTGMVTQHEQCIAAAKIAVAAGQDKEVLQMAGEAIADASDCLSDLEEWLGARGIGNAPAPEAENRIDADEARQRRIRQAHALTHANPI